MNTNNNKNSMAELNKLELPIINRKQYVKDEDLKLKNLSEMHNNSDGKKL